MFTKNALLRTLITAGLTTSLVACGGDGSSSTTPTEQTPVNETSEPDAQEPSANQPTTEEPTTEEPTTDEPTTEEPTTEEPTTEEPTTEEPAPENYEAVTDLTVNDENRVPASSDDFIMGPFTGLSESGKALALWETSDFDILGTGNWISTLHYVSGDTGSKSWSAEQSLALNINVTSLDMEMGANGNTVIIYTTQDNINAVHFNPESGVLSSPIQLKKIPNAQITELEVNSDGDALAVWKEEDTGNVVARFYDAANQSWITSETVLNRSATDVQYESDGYVTARLNDTGQALFTDSAIKAGQGENGLITRVFDGTSWSDITEHGNPLSPHRNNVSDISADLTEDGRIAIAVGREAPGAAYVATGTITTDIGAFVSTYYEDGVQDLSYLDVRWTGNSQITATYLSNDNSYDRHFFSRSEDAGENWIQGPYYQTVSVGDRSVAGNANNTIYIQDGAQCSRDGGGFGAPLFALNHNGQIIGTCDINRMTDTSVAVNNAGSGIVAGEHDAIDAVILHFFESTY